MASAQSAFAAGGSAPTPSAKPATANVKDEKTPVSVSRMAAPEYVQCISDLTSSHAVFQQAGDVTEQGCKLSGAIRLKAVTTAVGSVSMSGAPAMLCSFAQEFSGWVREVAAPLARGYMGQGLARIETGEAFACRARYDKRGAVPSEHAKGNAVDIAAFVLADGRRILVKQQDDAAARDLVHALRMTVHYRPRPRDRPGPRSPLPLRLWPAWRDGELPHLRMSGWIASFACGEQAGVKGRSRLQTTIFFISAYASDAMLWCLGDHPRV
jgi:hypothetical protein